MLCKFDEALLGFRCRSSRRRRRDRYKPDFKVNEKSKRLKTKLNENFNIKKFLYSVGTTGKRIIILFYIQLFGITDCFALFICGRLQLLVLLF